MLGQVFGFVQREQRLDNGQALEDPLHGRVGGGRGGLPGEPPELAQEVLVHSTVPESEPTNRSNRHGIFALTVVTPIFYI